MKLFPLIPLITLSMLSCKTTRVVEKDSSSDSLRLETVYIEKVVTDTITVQLPAERVEVTAMPTDPDTLHTSLATSVAYVDSMGFLRHKLWNNKADLSVIVQKTEVVRDSIQYVTKWRTKCVTKEKLPTKFEKFRQDSWYFLAALLAIAVLYLTKFRR